MKSIRSYLTFMFLPCLLSLQQCDEPLTEFEKLPPATQGGMGTFGCLVDGKAWVIEGITDVQAYYQTGTLFIAASLETVNRDEGIVIGALSINLAEQEYELVDYPEIFGKFNDSDTGCEYPTSTMHKGKLTITHLDQTNFIMSGKFEFEGYSMNCGRVIKITDGRFDIQYAP